MNNVEFVEEDVRKTVATGVLPLDGLRMSSDEQRKKVFELLEEEGYDLGDTSELEISYEGADNYGDEQSTKFVVTRVVKESVPYQINREEIFAGSFILDGLEKNDLLQKEKIYEMMSEAGIVVSDTDEIEIGYEGASSYEDGMATNFVVFKVTRERLDEDFQTEVIEGGKLDEMLKPEEIEIEEVEMEELVSGTINVEGLNSEDEINNKVIELLNVSGVDVANIGELRFSYGDVTEDFKLPFSVSKVLVDRVKYRVDRELIGTGEKSDTEDIYASIQRCFGLDVRDDPNYDIVYGEKNDNELHYSLLKNSRTRLGVIEEDNSLEDVLDSSENFKEEYKNVVEEHKSKEKVKDLEQMTNEEISVELRKMLDSVTMEIDNLTEEVNDRTRRYEMAISDIETVMNQEITRLGEIGFLTDEEIVDLRSGYVQKKLEDNFKALTLKKEMQQMKRKLISLTRMKNKVEKNIFKVENAELDVEEYKEIMAMLAEQKQDVNEGMKVYSVSDNFLSKNKEASVLDNVDVLYGIDTTGVLQTKVRQAKASIGSLEMIKSNSFNLPEKIVNNNGSVNSYVPGDAPKDMIEAMDRVKESLEKLIVYRDSNGNSYVRNNVFQRFNISKQGEERKINNASFYKIDDKDLELIKARADNDYSPYIVEEAEEILDNNNVSDEQNSGVLEIPSKNRDVKDLFDNNYDTLERITIYNDSDNANAKYVRKNVLERFNLKPRGDEVRINNVACYEISEEDCEYIINNANNDYSPYGVLVKEASIEGTNNNSDDKKETIKKQTIVIYRAINDNNQLYASSSILNKFGIKPTGRMTKIKGKNCYKIDEETDALINELAIESKNPIYNVKYEDVNLKKKRKKNKNTSNEDSEEINNSPRPHVEAILDKLTRDLDIRAKDCKKFKYSNIRVADIFKSELKSGNVLYNINHFVSTVIKTGFSFLRKMSAKLMTSARARKSMTELKRRLDEDLTEEELDVLFEEYRGSQLKADMNNQINDLILDRLRAHGMAKVEIMNQNIKDGYSHLFGLLGQIKAIEKTLNEDEIDDELADSLRVERKALLDEAAIHVKSILVNRKDANNLLSGGIHGLEEDFKAVSTKLSYVGMRFGKNNRFDNELQHMLGTYGQGLNDALAVSDNEAIVDNFMGLESCYYDNTVIAKSIFGNRSVGDKYYSPLAEQFDYRDDPFIRDVCVTLTTISAGVSAIESFRVHQIESKEILKAHQEEANNVNSANDSVMDYVHQTGRDIESRREAFEEGMKAQSHQDVLNSANAIERAELDMSNWSFGQAYRAADSRGHEFFNGFHQNVSSQINDITTKYGVGDITRVEVLQELAGVANNAQNTLKNVSGECLSILNNYAKTHPNFDLTAIKESLNYITANPEAIANMNNGMVDVTNLAGGLQELAANHVTVIESLPSDMASTIICAASATALALNVSKTMRNKYNKKTGYGNEITDMMEEYLNGQVPEAEDMELDDLDENTHNR